MSWSGAGSPPREEYKQNNTTHMNIKKLSTITAALSATLLLGATCLQAQDATAAATPASTTSGSNAGGGGRGGRGNWQQMMADRLKTQLKATDDEWAVIQPLLQKVQDAQRAARGGFGGFGGPGGGGP